MSKKVLTLISCILLASASSVSHSAPHGDHSGQGHAKSMGGSHKAHGNTHHKKSRKKGHTFSPHWAKTLSDEQKVSFDKMHLQVGKVEAVQRAKMKMLKAELNVLATDSSTKKSQIYSKIDEILAVKKGIMRNRFDHIVEMRGELTEQQRISYDMGVLKRGKDKKHKH